LGLNEKKATSEPDTSADEIIKNNNSPKDKKVPEVMAKGIIILKINTE
jgi:hypothetical protein